MKKDIDCQFLCKDCERYGLCNYYHGRKEKSYICKYFHLSNKKVGHWIDHPYDKDYSKCSECGSNWEKAIIKFCRVNYCPNCGVKMESEVNYE